MPPQGYRPAVIKNPTQAKVHMDKPDCLFYYLPKHSTEGKSKFTDEPNGRFPVSTADFLDRVKSVQPPPQNVVKSKPVQAQAQQLFQPPRPYNYKPKSFSSGQFQPHGDEIARRMSSGQMPMNAYNAPPLRPQVSDPVRPFPDDVYYTSRKLPAAFPGQYSNYVQHVRQNSGGDSARIPFGQPSDSVVSQGHAHPVLQPSAEFRRPSAGSSMCRSLAWSDYC